MFRRIAFGLFLILLAGFVLPNLRSLYEGIIFYLRDTISYTPNPPHQIQRDGRYSSLYDLIQLRNAERQAYILKRLDKFRITQIPIPSSTQTDILVPMSPSGPYTVFSAHYDKIFDDSNYQGASDNTAAVSVLIASIDELARSNDGSAVAFLFTGEEERGLRGSAAFIDYARANNIAIRENVNFDNVGRGKLAIRPSAEAPGFVFTIPFLTDYAYDGRTFTPIPPSPSPSTNARGESRPIPSYPLAPPRLVQAVLRAQPDTIVYERFTARSDSNVFQENGIDTVAISGDDMRFLDLTWHTYADRIELLDEHNLDLAFDLILKFAMSLK
jgi:Zn-dependent M28 family amino/carboxypeptidase